MPKKSFMRLVRKHSVDCHEQSNNHKIRNKRMRQNKALFFFLPSFFLSFLFFPLSFLFIFPFSFPFPLSFPCFNFPLFLFPVSFPLLYLFLFPYFHLFTSPTSFSLTDSTPFLPSFPHFTITPPSISLCPLPTPSPAAAAPPGISPRSRRPLGFPPACWGGGSGFLSPQMPISGETPLVAQ